MKYMGSKNRVAKYISPILNREIVKIKAKNYVEPFVGGANMIQHISCKNRYGLDSNEYLISLFDALIRGWCPPDTISKQEYVNIRDSKETFSKEMVASAGFLSTYNAKWFGGYAGIVNTKAGIVRNYYDEARRNILKQLPSILSVIFLHKKYQDIDISKMMGCVVYCDPPYVNSTKYKDNFDHNEFWEWVRAVSKNNSVFVSEYVAPEDFVSIWEKQLTTTLDKSSRKKAVENLFVHKSTLGKID